MEDRASRWSVAVKPGFSSKPRGPHSRPPGPEFLRKASSNVCFSEAQTGLGNAAVCGEFRDGFSVQAVLPTVTAKVAGGGGRSQRRCACLPRAGAALDSPGWEAAAPGGLHPLPESCVRVRGALRPTDHCLLVLRLGVE